MKLLELPLDVFLTVIDVTVHELGVRGSMRARLVCRSFADAIPEALHRTRVIEYAYTSRLFLVSYRPEVIARYLLYRIRADRTNIHPWVQTNCQTVQTLAKHAGWAQDLQKVEMLYQASCSCLALYKGRGVFHALSVGAGDEMQYGGGTSANCLTVAAWVGDMALIKSFNLESNACSFFGRPLWAASAQGHLDVVKHFLNHNATENWLDTERGPWPGIARSPLDVAAYMGRESIVRLFLNPRYNNTTVQSWEGCAIHSAAIGGHANILTLLIHHYKEVKYPDDIVKTLHASLIQSCRHGMHQTAQVLLQHGAKPIYTDVFPRTSLQWAAITGNAALVKMLLDAGAELEPATERHFPSGKKMGNCRVWKDGLSEARDRGHKEVERLILERMAELQK
ncbi:uncharacterized protein K452DRAFT_363221 [Aplosporella prunicola CBS 121167]|uniref:Uncharacterized protein n=1 Tax=Aplosporella prunicola CBS 121167 TaxID=1176127 RepID=A0A6A6AUS4_9PEZI|nr:uncharacterized protein K452DRAFT_363221 [Aplosporella prunicola CBS 121167]KAF2135346.1 hypothetical protein K452DRAFT_363221 [Aplosporella prunicola CBS 121167]